MPLFDNMTSQTSQTFWEQHSRCWLSTEINFVATTCCPLNCHHFWSRRLAVSCPGVKEDFCNFCLIISDWSNTNIKREVSSYWRSMSTSSAEIKRKFVHCFLKTSKGEQLQNRWSLSGRLTAVAASQLKSPSWKVLSGSPNYYCYC